MRSTTACAALAAFLVFTAACPAFAVDPTEAVARIDTRPDELLRRAALAAQESTTDRAGAAHGRTTT